MEVVNCPYHHFVVLVAKLIHETNIYEQKAFRTVPDSQELVSKYQQGCQAGGKEGRKEVWISCWCPQQKHIKNSLERKLVQGKANEKLPQTIKYFSQTPPSSRAFLVAQTVKNLPARQETWIRSLGGEVPLEEGMATHSSILAWRTPWTERPGRLQAHGVTKSRTGLSD